jgi:predicted metalloprotease
MTFKRDVRLNPGQVRDVRGRGGGRGFGLPGGFGFPSGNGNGGGGVAIPTGGGIGLIVLVVIVVVVLFIASGGLGGLTGTDSSVNDATQNGQGDIASCQTGEDANARLDCRIVGYVNSIQAYWGSEGALALGVTYHDATTTLYDGSVNTGCGQATSDVGPFYCPVDENVYIDLGFFNVLTQLGAENAPLAQAYVVSHEYGHHIQKLTGVLEQARSSDTGPQSAQVRVELQADCYAGVWTGNSVDTGYLEALTQDQINSALAAAEAVGDDRIQSQTQGQVNPETWTHGSSEQRQFWYTQGFRAADPAACDTFSGSI